MVERLVEKTGPAVQLESGAQTKGERTRERIMDIAYESIVQKGFAATSIEELVEAAGITKSGFFYHFKDKNDLARQLLERFLAEDNDILDTLTARARELRDDPLQAFLVFLNLYAEVMDDMPQPASATSAAAKAAYLVTETKVLHTVCVTKPLPEHLPGLLRTGISLPIEPLWRSMDDCPAPAILEQTTPRAK